MCCDRTVNYIVLTKWKEHDLGKWRLFLIYTRVLAYISISSGKPGDLHGIQIISGVGNTFLKPGKDKGYIRPQAKSRLLPVYHHHHLGRTPGRVEFVSQSPFLMFSEMRFGEGVETLAALMICTILPCVTASVVVTCCQKSRRVKWKEERNEAVDGVLAITVVIVMASSLFSQGFMGHRALIQKSNDNNY